MRSSPARPCFHGEAGRGARVLCHVPVLSRFRLTLPLAVAPSSARQRRLNLQGGRRVLPFGMTNQAFQGICHGSPDLQPTQPDADVTRRTTATVPDVPARRCRSTASQGRGRAPVQQRRQGYPPAVPDVATGNPCPHSPDPQSKRRRSAGHGRQDSRGARPSTSGPCTDHLPQACNPHASARFELRCALIEMCCWVATALTRRRRTCRPTEATTCVAAASTLQAVEDAQRSPLQRWQPCRGRREWSAISAAPPCPCQS